MEEARKYYNLALRARDNDAIRIKLALLMPPVFTSHDDMLQRWKDVLSGLKKLLARPNFRLPNDAQVINTHREEIAPLI